MAEIVDLAGFRAGRQQLREAFQSLDDQPELARAMAELDRLVGPALRKLEEEPSQISLAENMRPEDVAALVLSETQKRCRPALNAVYGHLLLALLEVDWMRTKRSLMPAELKAGLEAMITSAAEST